IRMSTSRRTHAVLLLAALMAVCLLGAATAQNQTCPGGRLLLLTNGKIHTMDAQRSVVSRVRIANGTFVEVGDAASASGGCTDTIDLRGRTVIPGMIDNHFHVQLVGSRPGYETRAIETAFSIAELQAVIRDRAKGVPAGGFITAIGGILPRQFQENRLPTLAELDAASSQHPVYIHSSFNGPAVTNSLGKKFFESRGIQVSEAGMIQQNEPTWNALDALRSNWTLQDTKRTMQQVFSYFNSVGLTTVHSVLGSQERGPAQYFGWAEQRPMLELKQEGTLTLRLRLYFNTGPRVDGKPGNPELRDLLDNQMFDLGDDMVKTAGVGEHIVDWPLEGAVPLGEEYYQSVRLLAQRGWQLMEHSFNEPNHATRADVWERVNREFPITNLRWSIDHVNSIEPRTLNRMKALGVGVRAHGWRFLAGTPGQAGPPYRMLLESGIPVGTGMDGAQAAPINPWLNVYYMVTGKNVRGELINDGQQITREQAVWLYTGGNGWFSREENTLGSIQVGRLADLVVLNADVFDPKAVPDEAIRRVHSVLTILGGKIVHEIR
ncbi:MAG TPA: amidohydrolase family protein, partial [Terriglobia bacterium]|nr:amidohydrolase family protein [Terriglobia bacterium]